MIDKIIEEKNPDLILPIDADEFLTSNINKNPRNILENLDLNYVHYVKWKTYIPHEQIEPDSFVPNHMKFIRNPEIESFYKVIIPTKLFKKHDVFVKDGNHECENITEKMKKKLSSISMAHFPVRSHDQISSKILIGWLNVRSKPYLPEYHSWHWNDLFNQILHNDQIDIKNLAINYACKNPVKNQELINDPLNFNFCSDNMIKYGNLVNVNVKNNFITHADKIANELSKTKEENIDLKNKLNSKNDLNFQIEKENRFLSKIKGYFKNTP